MAAVVNELASGVNDRRSTLLARRTDPRVPRLVVEHRDRRTRVGFASLQGAGRTVLPDAFGQEIVGTAVCPVGLSVRTTRVA